jgi:hypothetical protein
MIELVDLKYQMLVDLIELIQLMEFITVGMFLHQNILQLEALLME